MIYYDVYISVLNVITILVSRTVIMLITLDIAYIQYGYSSKDIWVILRIVCGIINIIEKGTNYQPK